MTPQQPVRNDVANAGANSLPNFGVSGSRGEDEMNGATRLCQAGRFRSHTCLFRHTLELSNENLIRTGLVRKRFGYRSVAKANLGRFFT